MLTIDAGTRAASDEVTVYQYLRDAEGQEFVRSDGEVAVRDPFTVQLTESAPDIETVDVMEFGDLHPRRVAV